MPVKFKQKPTAKTKPKVVETTAFGLEQEVDQIGTLKEEIAKLKKAKPVLKLASLNKELKEIEGGCCDFIEKADVHPDSTVEIKGEKYEAEFGPQGKKREFVDGANQTLLEMLGEENFLKLASIKLGDIDKYLTPDDIDKVLEVSRVVSRSVKVKPRV